MRSDDEAERAKPTSEAPVWLVWLLVAIALPLFATLW